MLRLLTCPPARTPDDAPSAYREWERLVELLRAAGDVALESLDAPETWAASTALISDGLAVMSTRRAAQSRRAGDTQRAWFAARGFATTQLVQTAFDGAGDALFDRVRPQIYVGYGWATERGATLALSELLGLRVIGLRQIDARFRRLDAALCPLGSGHVLAYLDAFTPQARKLLRATIESDALIEVGAEDAQAFACGLVEIGDAVVTGALSRTLRSRLRFAGYRIFSTELSALAALGGSPKALTLRLDDGPACGAAAA